MASDTLETGARRLSIFVMGAYLSVALGIQDAPWMPHAVEFSSLYAYKITAKEEKVEVWEDFVGDHLEKGGFGSSRPFRSTQRYMRKGESIMISAATPRFISEDFSLDGKPIKRVRISRGDGLLSLLITADDRLATPRYIVTFASYQPLASQMPREIVGEAELLHYLQRVEVGMDELKIQMLCLNARLRSGDVVSKRAHVWKVKDENFRNRVPKVGPKTGPKTP